MSIGWGTLLTVDCREALPRPASVIVTDPPYGVDRHGVMLGFVAPNYHEKGTHTRGYADHDPERYRELMEPAFAGMAASVPRGGLVLSFAGNRTTGQLIHWAERAGLEQLDVLPIGGGSSPARSRTMLAPRHELLIVFRRKGATAWPFNPGRNIGNLWNIPKGRVPESEHLTPKSPAWMDRVVEVFTRPEDLVGDPFAGSGQTLLAAARAGRNYWGMEKSPEAAAEARGFLDRLEES